MGSLTLALALVTLAAISITGYYLFFRYQMRLPELMSITAFLGTVLGLGIKNLVPERISEDDIPKYFSLGLVAILWALGGAGWAMRIIAFREILDTKKRLGVLVLGWMLVGIPVVMFLNGFLVFPSDYGFMFFVGAIVSVYFLLFLDSLIVKKAKK